MPTISPNTMSWIQATSWLAAVLAGIFGIVKIVIELRRSREQRDDDLRWRKAQAAKLLNDEMLSHEGAVAVMTLLDWDGRMYEIVAGTKVRIDTADMLHSLRVENLVFSPTETFVRDGFDFFFYYCALFHHYISRGLVDFEDLSYPVDYYIGLLSRNRPVFEAYLDEYRFARAKRFLDRFESWRGAAAARSLGSGSAPPAANELLAPAGN